MKEVNVWMGILELCEPILNSAHSGGFLSATPYLTKNYFFIEEVFGEYIDKRREGLYKHFTAL